MEIILDQERAADAKALLGRTGEHDLFVSDYALHSIGLLLFRRNQHYIFQKFVQDITVNAGISVVSVAVDDLQVIVAASKRYNLDFDDAYQYGLAEKDGLTLVNFDSDFDRTERGRKTPAEILH